MMLDRSPAFIVRHFYTTAENLFLNGDRDRALYLLDQLVAARPIDEARGDTVMVAQRFADERLFEPSYRLFKPLLEGAKGLQGKLIALRCAYLCLELDDADQAIVHLHQAAKFKVDSDETRASQHLVYGVLELKTGTPELALNHLANALYHAGTLSNTRQVCLYFNYLSYLKLDYSNLERPETEEYELRELEIEAAKRQQAEIASNILDELSLFFSDGTYTRALKNEP